MSHTVAMVQSSYIPWKGYFDMMAMADLFVFYDDVQFTHKDWRSRNRIKSREGTRWLTIPCGSPRGRLICDVELENSHWQRKHWENIRHSYARSRYFDDYRQLLEPLYRHDRWYNLSETNQTFIREIASALGITTEFADSRAFPVADHLVREDRWLEMLIQIGATRFIIGPRARNYLDGEAEARVLEAGIELVWMDYSDYPEYLQLYPPFEHQVSVIDLLFNHGPDATKYMKAFNTSRLYSGHQTAWKSNSLGHDHRRE